MNRERLFSERSLDAQIRARQDKIAVAVNSIPKDEFQSISEDDLVERIAPRSLIEPLVLLEERKTMDQSDIRVDVSGDPDRFFDSDRKEPFYVPGTRVNIDIPYSGEKWLFRYRTSPSFINLPQAEVLDGVLRITIEKPHDVKSDAFKIEFDQRMDLIRECVNRSRRQVESYNTDIPDLVRRVAAERYKYLDRHKGVAEVLGIPMVKRGNIPNSDRPR